MKKFNLLVIGNYTTNEYAAEVLNIKHWQDKNLSDLDRKNSNEIFNKLAMDIDIIILNTIDVRLSMMEMLLLQLAYTKNTPILTVGDISENNFFKSISTDNFDSINNAFDEAIDISTKITWR